MPRFFACCWIAGALVLALFGCSGSEPVVQVRDDLTAPTLAPSASATPVSTPVPTPSPSSDPTPFEVVEPEAPGGPSQTPSLAPTADPFNRDDDEGME